MGFVDWIAHRMRKEETVRELAHDQPASPLYFRSAIQSLLGSEFEYLHLCSIDMGFRIQIGAPTADDPTLGVNICDYASMDSPDLLMREHQIEVPKALTLEEWDVEAFALYRAPQDEVNAVALFAHRIFTSLYGCPNDYAVAAWLQSSTQPSTSLPSTQLRASPGSGRSTPQHEASDDSVSKGRR